MISDETKQLDSADESQPAWWTRRRSRGRFLAGAAATALAGSTLSILAPAVEAAVDRAKLDKELNFYNWSAWVGPTEVPRFEKKYGVKVRQDIYDSNDTLYAKLKAGGGSQYDVIIPTGYLVTRMIREGMLKKLNYANIPNARNLSPSFAHLPYDNGNLYSIPNDWGGVGYMYRSDMVKDKFASWADLWRLAPKYHRKIVILGTPRDVIGAALKLNGYSCNSRKTSELLKARDSLLQIKPHILEITSSDQRPALLRGDAAVVMDWPEEYPTAAADKKVGKYVKWVNPTEGMPAYVDELAIPAGAPHPYTAEVFLNWLLDSKNYAEFVNFEPTAFTMKPSRYIDKSLTDSPIVTPPQEFVRKNYEFQNDVGAANALYVRIWTEFKAA